MRQRVEMAVAILAGAFAVPAASQSIADYSHAQRALLEASMAQAAARMAALGASNPGPDASGATASPPPAVMPTRAAEVPETPIRVDGVFDVGERRLAEVTVDGHPYLLAPGQAVPGTGWHVAEIAVDRVTLARAAAPGAATRAHPTTKTFALPALAPSRAPTP